MSVRRAVDGAVLVRPRVDADMDDVVRIAAAVQEAEGYPGRRPPDLRAFMGGSDDDALGAWVAERDGALVGHVALHRESLPVVMDRAGAVLGLRADELAAVARLVVDPAARRSGIGRALLEAAAGGAWERGLHPVLDVVVHYQAAVSLYRSCGWRNAGEVTMVFDDGGRLQSYVFVAPDAAGAVRNAHDWFEVNSGWAPPDDDELAEWLADDVCRSPDDCLVAPGGWCRHGLASWWLILRDMGAV